MREYVMFKGDKDGLQLLLDASIEFDVIIGQLKNKLSAASNFFASGAKVNILSNNGSFSEDERDQLVHLLEDYGLCYNNCNLYAQSCQQASENEDPFNDYFADSLSLPVEYIQTDDENQTLVVGKVLRGGQKLIYSGTVIVMGNVNPNAQIVAGGDIIVHGTCWGLVHAGAFGDTGATITADKLVASQLRIAGLIARSPDTFHDPLYPEKARVLKGELIIEPAIGNLAQNDLGIARSQTA